MPGCSRPLFWQSGCPGSWTWKRSLGSSRSNFSRSCCSSLLPLAIAVLRAAHMSPRSRRNCPTTGGGMRLHVVPGVRKDLVIS
eukprot:9082296-Prorocentrum_lima.AAC.2